MRKKCNILSYFCQIDVNFDLTKCHIRQFQKKDEQTKHIFGQNIALIMTNFPINYQLKTFKLFRRKNLFFATLIQLSIAEKTFVFDVTSRERNKASVRFRGFGDSFGN
jgi:hypothetical protein